MSIANIHALIDAENATLTARICMSIIIVKFILSHVRAYYFNIAR
jgi:hypothetical protein